MHRPAEAFRALTPDQAALFESSPYPTLVLDSAFRIRYVNAAAARVGGVDASDLLGHVIWDRYPDFEGSEVHRAYAKVLEDGKPRQFDQHRVEGDRWLSVHAYPADGGVIAVLEDITQRRAEEAERLRVTAQMQQAQKLESLGVLSGGIAHDFNNLLVGILGNASLALLDMAPDAEARRSVEEIEQAAQRAAELTRQLLAYAGKGRFVVETVDASGVVAEMTTLLRTAVSRSASIQLDLPAGLPNIEVDTTQFRQVLMNLMTNASDALGERPGTIEVRTCRAELTPETLRHCVPGIEAVPGTYVCIEVRDDGIGMDAPTVARMFDPFFSTKFSGRGLGLAATLGIVRGHRGAIEVESAPGKGTTVRLYFPATASAARVTVSARDGDWRGAGRVLIVDDEDSVRAVSGALLRRRGFETRDAEDGHEAIAALEADPDGFSLVLLDLTMPGLGGEATFRALHDIRPDLRIVLMSGYSEQEVTRMFESQGLAGFLQKPFRAEDLYSTVARTLGIERRGRP